LVVRGESVLLAVESEFAVGDAVAEPADRRAEVGIAIRKVTFGGVEAVGDVGDLTVLIRDFHGDKGRAEIGDLRAQPVLVGERVKLRLAAVWKFSESFHGNVGVGSGA